MMTFLFVILMLLVFGKILAFAIRATWSIARIFFTVVFLPLLLIGLVIKGLIVIAFPILIVIGLMSLFKLND